MIMFLIWYIAGLFGALLGWWNQIKIADGKSSWYRECPSLFEITCMLLASTGGLILLAVTLMISMDRCGIWYKQGRFDWFFKPVCGTKK